MRSMTLNNVAEVGLRLPRWEKPPLDVQRGIAAAVELAGQPLLCRLNQEGFSHNLLQAKVYFILGLADDHDGATVRTLEGHPLLDYAMPSDEEIKSFPSDPKYPSDRIFVPDSVFMIGGRSFGYLSGQYRIQFDRCWEAEFGNRPNSRSGFFLRQIEVELTGTA